MEETGKRMSADGIIRSLRLCADKENNFTECVSGQLDCPFSETVIDCDQRMKRAGADALAAATARIAELEAEVQGLRANSMIHKQIIKNGRNPLDTDAIIRLILEKTALQAHDKEVMGKVILWGVDLIESNSDAHITFCAECGFPIADYRVNEEIHCSWCKAKNNSHNYIPAGPGYCKTTLDRKAKTFDRLFCNGCRAQEVRKSDR